MATCLDLSTRSTSEAIEIAENAKKNLPLYGDPTMLSFVLLVCSLEIISKCIKITKRNEDADQIALGIADLELLGNEPSHYYGLLAARDCGGSASYHK